MPPIVRVDHLVVAVRDLPEATAAYSTMLGLAPSWRGIHPEHGTANTIFGLANCYVELLALGPGQATSPVALALEAYLAKKPEGLFAIALGTDDAAAAHAQLTGAGLTATPVAPGEARNDGGATRRWKSFVMPREAARGVNVIVIEHIDRPPAPSRSLADATSSATGVDHVVLFSDDMRGGLALWRDTLGIGERWQREIPERGTLNVGLKISGVTIELVAPLGNSAGERGERLWGAAYAVPDCDAAVARLRSADVPVTDARAGLAPRTRVATVRWADRVPTLVIEHLRVSSVSSETEHSRKHPEQRDERREHHRHSDGDGGAIGSGVGAAPARTRPAADEAEASVHARESTAPPTRRQRWIHPMIGRVSLCRREKFRMARR